MTRGSVQIRGSGDYEGLEFVVEPNFREQFEITHPTTHYAELLAAVPQLFVGPTSRLVPVVQVGGASKGWRTAT